MSLEQLRSARHKSVGTKETMKAVQSGIALKVFVADDADKHVVEPLRDLCLAHSVAVERVASMRELGDLCGIEVGAASAAVLEQSVDS